MSKPESLKWYDIETYGPPPYDTLVVVHGDREVIDYTGKSYGFVPCKALAYNNCYRPEMMMTQVVELPKAHEGKLPVYMEVPFTITKWMLLGD